MKNSLFCLFGSLLFFACGKSSSADSELEFPEVVSIDSLKQTEFVATLENQLAPGKNSIYSVSMLLAWDQFRTVFGTPLVCDNRSTAGFLLLNASSSFKNVLDPSECELSSEVHDDGSVTCYAGFSQSLPFKYDMHRAKAGLNFSGTQVNAFGILYYDEDALMGVSILYYEDDSHFVVKLWPKDEGHEIILATGIDLNGSFSDLLERTNTLIDSGDTQLSHQMTAWRRAFNEDDTLIIPSLQFNIQKSWGEFVGQTFTAPDGDHVIVQSEQRTAFVLNEHGAAIESEMVMTSDSIAPAGEIPHPKRMYFTKPFFLYLKRTNFHQPYFALKVETPELMEIWQPKKMATE